MYSFIYLQYLFRVSKKIYIYIDEYIYAYVDRKREEKMFGHMYIYIYTDTVIDIHRF